MQKNRVQKATIILLICYLFAAILNLDVLGNLLSPLIAFGATYATFRTFFQKEKVKERKIAGLLLTLSIFSWGICDVFWAVSEIVFEIPPENVEFITYGYYLTNAFMVTAILVFSFYEMRTWNGIQLLVDTLAISILVILLVWTIFFDKKIKNIGVMQEDKLAFIGITFDLMIVIWIGIMYFSRRGEKAPRFMVVLASAGILFVIMDFTYYYEYFYKTYEPNSYLDVGFAASFTLMALSAMVKTKADEAIQVVSMKEVGRKGNGIFIIIAPIILVLFKGFELQYIVHMVLIIVFYLIATSNIQALIHKTQLNDRLEHMVEERTKELQQKNQELDFLLNLDVVTGLFNKRYFLNHLKKEIASLEEPEQIMLFYIDINKFKLIRTMYDSEICDMVIRSVGNQLKRFEGNKEASIVASYGDDAFVIAQKGAFSYEDGLKRAKELIKSCSRIYLAGGFEFIITYNLGISIFPQDAKSRRDLIKHADIAMLQARTVGYNSAMVFDAKLGELAFRRNEVEILLKRVNHKKAFQLYYQPQVNMIDKTVVGFEALIRWKTETGEFIPPSEFIPIAEDTGCIIPIGDWVMQEALGQLEEWNKYSSLRPRIGINVSLRQLNGEHFFNRLKAEIERYSLNPEWIDIEITETMELEKNDKIIELLKAFRTMGMSISIDDFGTGYSSLYYLKNLPIDRLKIAKPLIDFIDIDKYDYEIVKAVITMAKVRGITVIAEGVETEDQWNCLQELGCDEVQGYYFGKPTPAEVAFDTFLGEGLVSDRKADRSR